MSIELTPSAGSILRNAFPAPARPPANARSSVRVCEELGITFRQLDYWIRTELITPYGAAKGSGSRRLFSETDFRTLKLVKAMLDNGLHLSVARAVVDRVRLHIETYETFWIVLRAEFSWRGNQAKGYGTSTDFDLEIAMTPQALLPLVSETSCWVCRID